MTGDGPLHVCVLSMEFPPWTAWGGIGTYAAGLVAGLARSGHRVTVISRSSPGAPAVERTADGVEVRRVGATIARRRLAGRTLDRLARGREVAAELGRLHAERPVDLLEAGEADLEARPFLAMPTFAARTVIQCHGSNAHGQIVRGMLGPVHRLDWAWSLALESDALKRARRVCVPSRAMREMLTGRGVAESAIRVVPHGVDVDRFAPQPPRPRGGRPVTVGFVGRLEARKGVEFLWRVVDAIGPDGGIRFRLFGEIHPSLRDETTARLARTTTYVEHVPRLPHAGMPDALRALDVLLLPSRFESFGLAYVEAMACGLVVIAGRGGAGAEVVVDAESGVLVDPDGDIAPAVAVLQGLRTRFAAYDAMRAAARRRAVEEFSVASSVARKVAVYRELGA